MSIQIQPRESPLSLCLLNQEIQKEVLSFCGTEDPFLYARVNRAAAFSRQDAASSLYFNLKNTNYLDWGKVEKDAATIVRLKDQDVQHLNVEQTQDFIGFLHQLREVVTLEEGDAKKIRLFKLFLSFCPQVTRLDLTSKGSYNGVRMQQDDMKKYPNRAVVSSILETAGIQSRIKELSLNGYDKDWNLIPIFSSHIVHFDALESLECHLSPEDLELLTSTPSFQKHLKFLSFERSELLSLAPLGKLESLQELDLYGSTVTDFYGQPELPYMPQLRKLELGAASHFEDATISLICDAFPQLERLQIEDAKRITDEGVRPISSLKFLRELYLSTCSKLTDKAFEYLAASPYLKENLRCLHVKNCKATANRGLSHIAKLTNLRELDLSGSEFTEDQFVSLPSLQKLEKLDCSFIKATDQILACLGEIGSLRIITFYNGSSGKEVTDQGLESIKNLQNLRSLTLHNCDQISDQGYQHLGNLRRLEHIWMESRRSISTNTLQSLGGLRKLKKLYLYGSGLDAPNETVKAFLSSYPELDYSCVGLGNKNPKAIRELMQGR